MLWEVNVRGLGTVAIVEKSSWADAMDWAMARYAGVSVKAV